MSSGTPNLPLIPDMVAEQFDDMVMLAFQGKQMLAGLHQTHDNVMASVDQFNIMGEVDELDLRAPNSGNVNVQTPDFGQNLATLQGYALGLPLDSMAKVQLRFGQVLWDQYAKGLGLSMGRKQDFILIDEGLVPTGTTPLPVDGGGNLTIKQLKDALEFLQASDGDTEEIEFNIAYTEKQARSLLDETEVTNDQFNSTRVLVNGRISTYLGFKFHIINSKRKAGLPLNGNVRKIFAWRSEAVGVSNGIGFPFVERARETRKLSDLMVGAIFTGATPIQDSGIIPILCQES